MKLPRRPNTMYSGFGGRINYSRSRHEDGGGRLSLYYGRDLDREIGGSIRVEYHVGNPVYALGGHVEVSQDEVPFKLGAYLWPVSLYLNIETSTARRIVRRITRPLWDGEREIALHIAPRSNRTTVRWMIWHPSMSWKSGTSRWRHGSFDFADALLGRRDMRWEPVETVPVSIPMPEGTYNGTVELRDHVSWRKRLPFWTRRLRCANVEIPGGIGKPGKGENSWDCGDDATFGMSCPARTVEEAIGKVVASVYRDRKRYGGTYIFTPMEAKSA